MKGRIVDSPGNWTCAICEEMKTDEACITNESNGTDICCQCITEEDRERERRQWS